MQRFFSKVEITDGCWNWTAGTNGSGYGYFGHEGRKLVAHRFLYVALNGPVPSSLQMDHLCRNRRCVRPSHLEPVTPLVNTRRADNHHRDKTHCRNGHPYDAANTFYNAEGRLCITCRRQHGLTSRAKRNALGLCAACSKPRDSEAVRCSTCQEKHNEGTKRWKMEMRTKRATTVSSAAVPTAPAT